MAMQGIVARGDAFCLELLMLYSSSIPPAFLGEPSSTNHSSSKGYRPAFTPASTVKTCTHVSTGMIAAAFCKFPSSHAEHRSGHLPWHLQITVADLLYEKSSHHE